MLRVDHAGERSAVKIYAGQLAVFGVTPQLAHTKTLIEHMAAQESRHLETFERLLRNHRVRPTLLTPLWDVAGFTLGAVTALLGEKAAMACTVAVEDVIDEHYAKQHAKLKDRAEDRELAAIVEDFRREELEHRATALAQGAQSLPGYRFLSGLIKTGCRMAIRLSERF